MNNFMNTKERIVELDKKRIEELKLDQSKAIFLDRDGVIIKDVGYISKAKDVCLEKGVSALLKFAYKLNIPVFIITNQSGISRGYFEWEDFDKVNCKMLDLIEYPSPIVSIFANSHITISKDNWRKPNPTMLLIASEKYNLNLKKSIFIGDRLSDMLAGCKSGIETLIHVKTGHGEKECSSIMNYCHEKFFILEEKRSKIIFLENLLKFPFSMYP